MRETYNKIAEDWWKDHRDDTWWVEGMDKFASFLKKGDAVLDIGCGAGTKTKYLIRKGLDVLGIDFSEEMIRIARREVPEGKFLVMNAKNLSGLEQEFDGVLAHAILLHIPKKEVCDVLQNWVSKLKPHGYLCLAVKEIKSDEKEEMIVEEKGYGYPYERFFSYFSTEEIKRSLADLDVKILWEKKVISGKTSWIQIICQKSANRRLRS